MKARKGMLTGLRDEERGVTTVVVVVSLIGIFSAVVLSLGFGSAWANRRTIITATDGAALQQARLAALTGAACDDLAPAIQNWSNFLARNANDITFQNCDLVPDTAHPGTGYVLVEARKRANAPFGGLFGIADTQPYSLSAVEYGFVPKPEGLRPMSFCVDNAAVQQWIWYQNWRRANGLTPGSPDANYGQITQAAYEALKGTLDVGRPPQKGVDFHYPFQTGDSVFFVPPPDTTTSPANYRIDYPLGSAENGVGGTSYLSYGVVHRMYFTKDTVYENGNCGSSEGNWGWIDFNQGSNSTDDQNDWISNGYDGEVAANDCNADDTVGDACEGDTGSSGGAGASELQDLVDNETQFHIPIFSSVNAPGANSQFQIWGFLPLILRGFKVTGAESTRYFDFEFKNVISSGKCCAKTGGLGSQPGFRICEVDHDGDMSAATIAARCGQ